MTQNINLLLLPLFLGLFHIILYCDITSMSLPKENADECISELIRPLSYDSTSGLNRAATFQILKKECKNEKKR